MPWYGWVGVVLVGLVVLTTVIEQGPPSVRGAVLAAAGLVLAGVGFGLRRPARPVPPPVSVPRR
jgi:uncharacterized membrane protein